MFARGEHFSHRASLLGALHCNFNSTTVLAEFHSSQTIHCIVPMHNAGVVGVEVALNMHQDTASGLTFTYDLVVLLSAAPSHGPISGGSFAVIDVKHTAPPLREAARDSLACHFGTLTVCASFDATGKISCVSPRSRLGVTNAVVLSVSNSDVIFASRLSFVYDGEPVLAVPHPLMGPAEGATLVSVFGSGFLASPYVWCKFMSGANTTRMYGALVVARRVTSTFVQCTSPQLAAGFSSVSISFNGVDFSEDAVMFELHDPIQLLAVVPMVGMASGDVPVHVYGRGLSHRASNLGYLRCLFGNVSAAAELTLSGSELVCVSPRGKPGLAALRVTNNLVDWSRTYLWYEYTVVRLTRVTPSNGPVRGGTVLTVEGGGFTVCLSRSSILKSVGHGHGRTHLFACSSHAHAVIN